MGKRYRRWKMNDGYVELDKLFDIFTELEARYVTNNLVIPEFNDLSWVELCNKGIEFLEKLRDE